MASYSRLLAVLLGVGFDTLSACMTGLFKRPEGLAYKRYVFYSLIRSLSRRDPKKVAFKRGTTAAAYQAIARKHRFLPDITPLESKANILWLGKPEKNNGKVLMYLHGGAYTNPAYGGHVELLLDQVKRSQSTGSELAVAMVEYTLAPMGQYPAQLRQAAVALNYILKTINVAPSNVLLAGDSAGGNLSLALLSHISHPHPDQVVPRIDLRGEKLGGTLLISPWVTFDTSAPSFTSNVKTDYLVLEPLTAASKAFLGNTKEDPYNTPLSAPVDWWENLQTRNLGIVASDAEMFFDDIMAFVEKVKVHNPQTQVFVAPGEAHVQCVLDKVMKFGPSKSQVDIAKWVDERLVTIK